MTPVATDIDTIDHLDFDETIPCGNKRCRAGHPQARWIVEFVCGCVDLTCQPCKAHLVAFARQAGDQPAVISCLECGHRRAGIVRQFIVRMEPLP